MNKGAFLLFMILCLQSCADDKTKTHNPGELVSVGIDIKFNVRYEELTRAEDVLSVYWVQVYTKQRGQQDNKYVPYAYGVFDNPSDMNIEVYSNMDYKLQAALFRDFSEAIKFPFTLKREGSNIDHYDKVDNTFIYSDTDYLSDKRKNNGLASVTYYDQSGNMIYYPEVEHVYYGHIENYNYLQHSDISLSLKRVNAGLKFVVRNLTEGLLRVTSRPGSTISKNFEIRGTDTDHVFETVFTCDELENVFLLDDDKSLAYYYYFDVVWEKDGGTVDVASRSYELLTGKITVIEVNLSQNPTGADEDTNIDMELQGQELKDGDRYVIEQI